MFGITPYKAWRARRGPRVAARPRLEALEGRQLLSATPLNGGQWAYGTRITYSFVPDGTSVGGVASNLNAKLGTDYGSAAWQQDIQKAFALWSGYANVNTAQVSDDGSPFGVSGKQQGDTRFGDIRIAMIPQGAGTLAYAMLPPPVNGGTNAGDIVFNSNYSFGAGGYDLPTVALHEVGHALGVDHSATVSDVMAAYYNGMVRTVSTDDAAALSSAYGPVAGEATKNDSAATATVIAVDATGKASRSGLSLGGTADQDWYAVTAPANTSGTLTVRMQTDALSSASPRFVIVASNGTTTLAQATAPNVYGTTVSASVPVTAGTKYYVRALPAASGAGSYGSYGLLVNFGTGTQSAIAPPNTSVDQAPDLGGSAATSKDSTGNTLLDRIYGELSQVVDQLLTANAIDGTLRQRTIEDLKDVDDKLFGQSPGAKELADEAKDLADFLKDSNKAAQLEASQAFLGHIFHAGGMNTFGDALTVAEFGGMGAQGHHARPEVSPGVVPHAPPGHKASHPDAAGVGPIVVITPPGVSDCNSADVSGPTQRRPIRRPFPPF